MSQPAPPAPEVALIYARGRNWCIGADAGLPWHLPDEFRHFKRTTMGRPVLMGRRTYADHQSALPGRTNVVLTSDAGLDVAEGVLVRSELGAALKEFGADGGTVFVIGGAGLFADAFPLADTVYETEIAADFEGDTYLKPLCFEGWDCEIIEQHDTDDRHAHAYEARRWTRR